MPAATLATVQSQIKTGKPAPVYLIVGDDERGKDDIVHLFQNLVPEDVRAFNLERVSALDTDPASIVATAQTLSLLADRRVLIVARAERWLMSKRKAKAGDESDADDAAGAASATAEEATTAAPGADALTSYVESPEPNTVLVLVASDINRTTRLAKALLKHALVVECWGLKGEKEAKGQGIAEALERAGRFVAAEAKKAGLTIDRQAIEPLLEHAGMDIAVLRGDMERLLLYCQGKSAITLEDVRAIVSGATMINAWGVTNAIERSDTRAALRELQLSFESGAVPYMMLGQLAWFVRSRLPMAAPGRVPSAVEAVFRTDMAMKTSGGEPRVLLERLVVELCSSGARAPGTATRRPWRPQ
jgi:DNA polymerase-3 subunit delta